MLNNRILETIYGADFLNYLKTLKLIVIGVGGIGCELLKNISRYNFQSIHILDMDTIEISNLSRQFLYRKHHVGQSKSQTAKTVMEKMHPHMKITALHANIKNYGVKFFEQFDIVFMALDNAEARDYVNKMCMQVDVVLLEAGTMGHKGQAMLIKKGLTRCYSCEPKAPQKNFAVCTIRTLPEKPIHCVTWAKHLFGLLFGPKDESNVLVDLLEKLDMSSPNFTSVFEEVFYKQIKGMKDVDDDNKFKHVEPLQISTLDLSQLANFEVEIKNELESINHYAFYFLHCCEELLKRKAKEGDLIFDKDDMLMAKFVTATSNIRSHIFKIPLQTEYNAQQMAGNIVPAITSTNSMVAAFQLSECMKFLLRIVFEEYSKKRGINSETREIYINPGNLNLKVLSAKPQKAKPECLACNDAFLPILVYADTTNFTLEDVITRVFNPAKENLEFEIHAGTNILYETNSYLEEDEIQTYAATAAKSLKQLFDQEEIELKFQEDKVMQKILIINKPTVPPHIFEYAKNMDHSIKKKIPIEQEALADAETNPSDTKMLLENSFSGSKVITNGDSKTHEAMLIEDDDDIVEEQPPVTVSNNLIAAVVAAATNGANVTNGGGVIPIDDSDDDLMIVEQEAPKKSIKKVTEASDDNPLKRTRADLENGDNIDGIEPLLKQTKNHA